LDPPVLHVLSNGKLPMKDVVERFKQLEPFVDCLHLREKGKSEEELKFWITTLLAAGIPKEKLLINTHYLLAAQYGLKGVHLPESCNAVLHIKRLYPQLLVGCSVHSVEAGLIREKEGADYVYFGNVFETSCKPGKKGVGVEYLEELSNSLSIPVIAIGGIIPNNVRSVLCAGSSGAAIMSAAMESSNPIIYIKKYFTSMKEGKN
jgi:thiazole tautomerase (transcriptional regulator TenI)